MTVPITISIPTFNRADRVYSLVQSLLPHLAEGDEIVVSDDASDDGTADRLVGVPKVTVQRHAKRLGMVPNWNFCLTAGSNPWVCLIHDDDRLTPEGLPAIRRMCAVAKEPALVAHAEWDRREQFSSGGMIYEVREPGAAASLRAIICPSGATLHRSIIEQIGGFSLEHPYSADIEFFPRICAKFPSYIISNPRVLEYILHEDNHQFKTWQRPDFLESLENVERAAIAHAGLDANTAQRLLRTHMIHHLAHMLKSARKMKDRALVKLVSAALQQRADQFGLRWRVSLATGRRFGWYSSRVFG